MPKSVDPSATRSGGVGVRRAVTAPGAATRARIRRHGFVDRPARTVVDAVALTTAIQAQEAGAARLGVRSRSEGLTDADVRQAMDVDRSVVRSWLMRSTIHLVAAEDVRWLTDLISPTIGRRFAKRWSDIGLTPRLLQGSAALMPELLRDGPLPLSAITAALAEAGLAVPVDIDPQAPIHVMLHASANGLICRGPERGREQTFALLDQWLPDAPPGPRGDDALAELARRYLTAFAPATAADFTAWSGLPSTRALGLIRDELVEADLDGRRVYTLRQPVSELTAGSDPAPVRLLSAYDNYLIGYRDRSLIIDDERRAAVYVGGVIKPAVLVDGRVAGIWRLTRPPQTGRPASVAVTSFVRVTPAVRRGIVAEVEDIGRFLGTDVTLTVD